MIRRGGAAPASGSRGPSGDAGVAPAIAAGGLVRPRGHKDDAFASTDPAKVDSRTGIRDPNTLGDVEKGAPTGGTLYGVAAARTTAIEALGPRPKTPAEAYKVMQRRMIKPPASDAPKM